MENDKQLRRETRKHGTITTGVYVGGLRVEAAKCPFCVGAEGGNMREILFWGGKPEEEARRFTLMVSRLTGSGLTEE